MTRNVTSIKAELDKRGIYSWETLERRVHAEDVLKEALEAEVWRQTEGRFTQCRAALLPGRKLGDNRVAVLTRGFRGDGSVGAWEAWCLLPFNGTDVQVGEQEFDAWPRAEWFHYSRGLNSTALEAIAQLIKHVQDEKAKEEPDAE